MKTIHIDNVQELKARADFNMEFHKLLNEELYIKLGELVHGFECKEILAALTFLASNVTYEYLKHDEYEACCLINSIADYMHDSMHMHFLTTPSSEKF